MMGQVARDEVAQTDAAVQVQMDMSIARGGYATMVVASLGENECMLTFLAHDLMASESNAVAHGVARVYVAGEKLRSIADLLARQADAYDDMKSK